MKTNSVKPQIVFIIPARKGSKRLKNKNSLTLAGRPLIWYTVEAAMAFKDNNPEYESRAVISTDIPDIIKYLYGIGRPAIEKRPERLATDTASTYDVVRDLVPKIEIRDGVVFDVIVILQPTSPLRDALDIRGAIKCFFRKKANAVISMCRAEVPVQWLFSIDGKGGMNPFMRMKSKRFSTPKQSLPELYRLNGAIYVFKRDFVMDAMRKNKNNVLSAKTYAYVMPENHSVDIDDKYDMLYASALLNQRS
ncbi:MAG: acylneuraminate cytidylyltransferase family protein [Planctomycetes bacterium]|nr:acylneuraminate cytidylyltransferase family protein [Planctomycetota bacterium]